MEDVYGEIPGTFLSELLKKDSALHLKNLRLHAHYVCQGYGLLMYSAFLWHVLKIVLGKVLRFLPSYHFIKLRATKCPVQPRFASSFGNYRL